MERAQGELSGSRWAEGLCWVESCSQVSVQVGLKGDPPCRLLSVQAFLIPPAQQGTAGLWNDPLTMCWSLREGWEPSPQLGLPQHCCRL